jgi:hypothetical protein
MEQQAEKFRPAALDRYAGQMLDVDAHEGVPINLWGEHFGATGRKFAEIIAQGALSAATAIEQDDAEITAHNVWNIKRNGAPGAFDFERRLQVMDKLGIRRQLIFPGDFGLLGAILFARADDSTVLSRVTGDRRAYALSVIAAHNDWCARTAAISDRLRPVAILTAPTAAELVEQARQLIRRGVRAFWIPVASPPGGLSPAHSDLDPLWNLLSDTNSAALAHIGADEGFLRTMVWREAEAFKGWKVGGEFSMDPYTLATNHLPTQNFITCLVMGGVFERHPRLRYGAIELAAHWIGPLADNLDFWYANTESFKVKHSGVKALKLRPSEYISRNIRVSAFDREDVGDYLSKYPQLANTYCFATDFPHPEGGVAPMDKFVASVGTHGEDAVRRFFVDNAEWLLPD